MGMLLLVLLLSAALATVFTLPVRLASNKVNLPNLGFLIRAILWMVLFCFLVPFLWGLLRSSTEFMMDPRVGESRWARYGLPAGTTDKFSYHSYYAGDGPNYFSDFHMSESDFLNWMDSQEWKASIIDPQNSSFVLPILAEGKLGDHEVTSGYEFQEDRESTRSSLQITYDADEERVYISETSF